MLSTNNKKKKHDTKLSFGVADLTKCTNLGLIIYIKISSIFHAFYVNLSWLRSQNILRVYVCTYVRTYVSWGLDLHSDHALTIEQAASMIDGVLSPSRGCNKIVDYSSLKSLALRRVGSIFR